MKTKTPFVLLVFVSMLIAVQVKAAESDHQSQKKGNTTPLKACTNLEADDATKLGLIKQMLAEGKPHAAIAHLDASKLKNEQSELLRADGLRQTGRIPQAKAIYEKLSNTCVSGYAYRGLGLIASLSGDATNAIDYLKTASGVLPTEHTIRNDYGYVLMQSGQYEFALHEFLTAVELAPDFKQAANNLMVLLYRQNDVDKAETFARRFGMDAQKIEQLRQIAAQLTAPTP